jgi:N-dimethylarginine dimethylaminohydrolase
MVIDHPDQIAFDRIDGPVVPAPGRVLLTTPEHYDVEYVINPHMEGNVGAVDRERAMAQWRALGDAYRTLGFEVSELPGRQGLPDMVFCANQTLPFRRPDDGRTGVVASRMNSVHRAPEVADFVRFFEGEGYLAIDLPDDIPGSFEGMGDAIWHTGRYLLWGGHGFRTDRRTYDAVSERLNVDILVLSLSDPDFYHLDTCFSVLDRDTVLIYPGAFDEVGLALIHSMFWRVLEAGEHESRRGFACNAHCPDGRHVLIQAGNPEACHLLQHNGFDPVELETGEFVKSGGSVFCMKQMFW